MSPLLRAAGTCSLTVSRPLALLLPHSYSLPALHRSAYISLQHAPPPREPSKTRTPPPASSPETPSASAAPSLQQLDEAFKLYRNIMRANRRAIPKLFTRRLADAFVKNEFRLHMAAAGDALRHSGGLVGSARGPAAPTEASSGEAQNGRFGRGCETQQTLNEDTVDSGVRTPGCTAMQFEQFLAAWEEYLSRASTTTRPSIHLGSSLRPSQRKLLSEQQWGLLKKLKGLNARPPPR